MSALPQPKLAPPPTDAHAPLRSFWMGGFEGADHVNAHGRPLDMVLAHGHLQRLDEDYARCAALGLRSLRESLGWRLTETAPGTYDFTRARLMARSARRHGVQLLWSLMHYGTPADVDLLKDDWTDRFAAYAAAAARVLAAESDGPIIYTPINEISFLAWAISASRLMQPYAARLQGPLESTLVSGYETKRRLVRAALAAVQAIRSVDPHARFMHVDPLVYVVPPPGQPQLQAQADEVASWQWQAWDMLAGRAEPQLGGSPEALDIVGVNHYHSGQWELLTEKRLRWHERDPRRKPPALLLREAWLRYHRPLVMAETSHFGDGRVDWLHDMATQVQRARADGARVQGLCLYPLVDRPDWDDAGHWHHSGLFDVQPPAPGAEAAPDSFPRTLHTGYAAALRWWRTRLPMPASRLPHARATPVAEPANQGTAMPPSTVSSLPPLVVFCHLRWGFVYQRPQHLLSRLSEHYRVLFVEEPVHCEGEPRLDRVPQGPNLEVLVPRTPVTAPGFHDDQLSLLKPLLAEFMRQEGIEDSLVWFYTPMALPLIAALKPRAVVYDCMDELSAFKNAPKQLRQRETALMKMASVVFTGGPALFEAKRQLHPNVHCLPSSVDVNHFAPQRLKADSAEAVEAQRLQANIAPGPRLGFYGVIDERLDLELVAAVADAHPEWQVVMVGPVVKIDPATLPQRANITYLGMQSYAMLPHLMAAWDLCLMPFALNESTRFISPTKTLEYMAGEKPVVSTAVRDVEVPYGDVVRIGRDRADFIAGCEEMLALTEAQRRLLVGRMQEALRKVSWDRSARTVLRCLRQALRDSTVDSPAALRELAGLAPAESAESAAAATLTRTPAAAQPPAVRHLIVGAGATGLAAAYYLGQHGEGHDTLVVEREEHVGGGCRSVHQQGYTFDHGAHVLQSGDPEVKALAERLLGDNLHWQPPRVRHVEQPAPQVGLPPLREDRDFGYPLHGGFQALMDAFLPLLDCELALKTTLLHLSPSRRTVRLDDGRSLRFDTLISTMPLPALVQACGDEAPAELRSAARSLRQGSLRCVNLGIGLAPGRGKLTDAHWMEAPAGTVFQRVFVQGNASAHNNAPGGFALSCEIAYGPDQPLPCEGAALIDRVIADCRRMGLFGSADPVHFASQLDLPCARALPDAAQQAALLLIRQWFGEHGIVLAGHHGRWQAESAPHAFTAGRQAAELVMTLLRQRGAQTATARQQAG